MALLGTEAFRTALADRLAIAKDEIVVLTAFATKPGIEWLLGKISLNSVSGKLVVRWRADDLLSGASDLRVYELARECGWDVYIYKDLHAKAFLIDHETVFVGSANVTGNGLSLVPGANRELGTHFTASNLDIKVFDTVLSESILLTEKLYGEMVLFLDAQSTKMAVHQEQIVWPEEIRKQLDASPEGLWVADLLWTTPDNLLREIREREAFSVEARHDLKLLGLELLVGVDSQNLKDSFLASRSWRWLEYQLQTAENHERFFGDLSSLLHNSLMDDPLPYRKNVKDLLQNLFSWAEVFAVPLVNVDVPGRKSQRVVLKHFV